VYFHYKVLRNKTTSEGNYLRISFFLNRFLYVSVPLFYQKNNPLALKIKYIILMTFLSLFGVTHLSFATTETPIQNSIKLDLLIKIHSIAGFPSDSTKVKKSEYELSSIIGFSSSLVAILSYGLYFFVLWHDYS